MVNKNSNKEKILQEILTIKDWRHPFDLGGNKVLSLERKELGVWNKWRSEISQRSIRQVMDANSFSILDLACNDGYFSFQLHDMASHVLGVDAREEAIRRANLLKQYYEYSSYEFKTADLRNYGLKSEDMENAFDLILCYGMLYHLTDPYDFLKRIFKFTKDTLSLSTFLSSNSRFPVLFVTKEDVRRPGSGLDPISMRPTHQAVVRLLYGAGFDLVLRFIPRRLSLYHHLEWGHFFGIKLNGRLKDEYIKKHNIQKKYNRFIRKDQLILCKDVYDINAQKQIDAPGCFSPFGYQLFMHKLKRKIHTQFIRT